MPLSTDINEYIEALIQSPRFSGQIAHHALLPEFPAETAEPERPWPEAISARLRDRDIEALYRHQAEAVDRVRRGRNVVVATPTASGKTLVYNLPVLERVLSRPSARALYLFPLKALAQDQLRSFREMAAMAPAIPATAAIYDGDTPDAERRKIRRNPPNVLFTNPDMLHLALLPHHAAWTEFFRNLAFVVVDEVHTYRGVMGAHMAQVFRRLVRLCHYYGSAPAFVFSSATVGNPDALASQLTGLPVDRVDRSGAPRGRKHLVLVDPAAGPAQAAILLLKAALHRGLRTIVYAQSRRLTELIALWAGRRTGRFANRIAAYRAGFLPEERREIEARLSSGDLLAVISTSALELGIDIGDLDLCLLVGYPGTAAATWQRAGRVGRSGRDSAVILVAGEDALDQYFIRHPEALLHRPPEDTVVNPDNPEVLRKHLVCAAAEVPLGAEEAILRSAPARRATADLESSGDLMRSADGGTLYSRRKAPQRNVDLRGSGDRFGIVGEDGERCGEIDAFRAFRETHPGAVYLHNGRTYLVRDLDLGTRTVRVARAKVNHYTRVRAVKETAILETYAQGNARGAPTGFGRLRVTDQVTGYETVQLHGGRRKINVFPLELPPQVFETEGLWFQVPMPVFQTLADQQRHFMGAIHAMEHAAIGILPLLVMADRNDLGGISTPFHPQIAGPAVFIYDGIPGGAGLARLAFGKANALLETTLGAVADCPCETGCPSCVHSPKCGSGNRPIDKGAALFLLETLRETAPPEGPPVPIPPAEPVAASRAAPNTRNSGQANGGQPTTPPAVALPPRPAEDVGEPAPAYPAGSPRPARAAGDLRYGVLDLETRRSADEVGGWHRADRMGISCVVLYDAGEDRYIEYLQDQVDLLVARLRELDRVIGFNIKKFDYAVLGAHSTFQFQNLPTLDLLEKVKQQLGFRLSLDHLAGETLGATKTADGLQALRWWKEGRLRDIIDYCRADVEITRDLYRFGRDQGYVLFRNKAGQQVRMPAGW
jgi:DEAD/DEAH box helicase domain-containing protein